MKNVWMSWIESGMPGAGLVVLCLYVLVFCTGGIAEQPALSVSVLDEVVRVRGCGGAVMGYRFAGVPYKPYAVELYSPAGVNILRDAPPDHKHHHGLMYAITVDEVNFWEEHKAPGRQSHAGLPMVAVKAVEGMSWAVFNEALRWKAPEGGEVLLNEIRTLAVPGCLDCGATVVVWESRFTLPGGQKRSATLTGSHYHGLGLRFVESMDGTGEFMNSAGGDGEVVRGTERLIPARWCSYTAPVDGKPVTVAMFGHPGNPRDPTLWFTMTKPFAYLSATLNLWREPLKVVSDRPLVLRYATAVWDGRVSRDQIEAVWDCWLRWPPAAGERNENRGGE